MANNVSAFGIITAMMKQLLHLFSIISYGNEFLRYDSKTEKYHSSCTNFVQQRVLGDNFLNVCDISKTNYAQENLPLKLSFI